MVIVFISVWIVILSIIILSVNKDRVRDEKVKEAQEEHFLHILKEVADNLTEEERTNFLEDKWVTRKWIYGEDSFNDYCKENCIVFGGLETRNKEYNAWLEDKKRQFFNAWNIRDNMDIALEIVCKKDEVKNEAAKKGLSGYWYLYDLCVRNGLFESDYLV